MSELTLIKGFEEMLSPKEVARILGLDYTRVLKEPYRSSIPWVRVGRQALRVEPSKLQQWIEERREVA
jgi:hypothetical protein